MEERTITNRDLEFGKRLKRLRRKADYTQEKLAEVSRLNTTFIGMLEAGIRKPSIKTLQKIASSLKISVKDLF